NDLWRSDGTAEGTYKVIDWGSSVANPERFFGTDERIWFQKEQYGTTSAWGIYNSDGTAEGTQQVQQFNFSNIGSAAFQFIEYNDGIIFLPSTGGGRELHFANDDGSNLIKAIYPGSFSPFIINMVEFNGEVYFIADDSTGDELWKTDGTFDGTIKVVDLDENGSGAFNFRDLVSDYTTTIGTCPSGLVFGGKTENGDYELFISDGTAEGTQLLKDINSGGEGSFPHDFWRGANYTYFTADDGVHGFELWRTDGTTEGTELVADIAEGPASSSAEEYIEKDGFLYFSAYSDYGHRKLFRIDQRCIIAEADLDPTICSTESLTANVNISDSESPIQSVLWNFGDDNSAEGENVEHTYSEPEQYNVDFQVSSEGNCQFTSSFVVTVTATPVAEIGIDDEILCVSQSFFPSHLSGSVNDNTDYTWILDGVAYDTEEPELLFSSSGNFSLALEVSNGDCLSSDETVINVQGPEVSLVESISPLCHDSEDGELTLSGEGQFGPFAYSLDNTTFGLDSTFTELQSGTYSVYIQDNTGCTTMTEVNLEGPEEIVADSDISGDDGSANGSIDLTITGGTPPYETSLNGGDFTDQTTFTSLSVGDYSLVIMDSNGCSVEVNKSVDLVDAILEQNSELSFLVYP
ncbi:MAG: PKD domain-containing protein, partial [Flavobacteriales bacterium]|nr:PKD domain-containing protein [Flavobacteriales bacterium]